MKLSLLEAFQFRPRVWGAVYGALILGTAKILLEAIFYISGFNLGILLTFDVETLVIAGVVLLPTLLWGVLLGAFAGRAYQHWQNNRKDLARSTLWNAGVGSTILNGAWFLLVIGVMYSNPLAPDPFWRFLLWRAATSVCLQVSFLMVVISQFIPRIGHDTVQITERWRL